MRVGSVANQRCHLMIVHYEEKWYNKLSTRTLSCFANQPIHLAGIAEGKNRCWLSYSILCIYH